MIEAQVKADKSNSGVKLNFRGGTTFVEPNLPGFTDEELTSRLSLMLKGVDAVAKEKKIILASEDENEDDEVDLLSQSILYRKTPVKQSPKCSEGENSLLHSRLL